MGWLFYEADYFTNGKIDKKAEIENNILNLETREIRKSVMVGYVYYAAIAEVREFDKSTNMYVNIPEEKQTVFAAVVLTHTNGREFGYKAMTEFDGPAESKCPESILKLLTPTDKGYAVDWRKRCEEYNKKKKNSPYKLPIGTVIEVTFGDGETYKLVKMAPAYQFKTPFWYNPTTGKYVKKSRIPSDYKVITLGND